MALASSAARDEAGDTQREGFVTLLEVLLVFDNPCDRLLVSPMQESVMKVMKSNQVFENIKKKEIYVTIRCTMLNFAFVVCWMPFVVVNCSPKLGHDRRLFQITTWLGK